MQRSKLLAVGLLCFAVTSGLAVDRACARESFRLSPSALSMFGMEGGYVWISGNALIPSGGRPGSGELVNVSKELGVDQGEATSVVFRSVILKRHMLNIEYLNFLPNGVKKVRRTFVFHNKTYQKGTRVETKLELNWLRLEYGYRFGTGKGRSVAPRIGLHYVDQGLTLIGDTREAGKISNTRRLGGTYPVIGVAAYQKLPAGMTLRIEMEGIHMITRGYLALVGIGGTWEVYPDVVLTFGGSNRLVRYIETNQPLNNQWTYAVFSMTAGVSVTF